MTTLTKRMAEDLTQYYQELGVRVRYLHSDIETLERVQILRDLRRGEFDVLVGINLLREGLDLPEVSLVAILDADKEGFLRSAGSLDSDLGPGGPERATGSVIMYADTVTDSMRGAIGETERRRTLQQAYNVEHGITPQSIVKAIDEVMSERVRARLLHPGGDGRRHRTVPQPAAARRAHRASSRSRCGPRPPTSISKRRPSLRDEIKRLRNPELGLPADTEGAARVSNESSKAAALEVQEYVRLTTAAMRGIFTPPHYRHDIVEQLDAVGVQSLTVVLLTGFFTGAVLALQSGLTLDQFGARPVVGRLVSASMIKELGPVLTGLMLTGRVGSGIAAELGSMVVTDQINALRALGTDPIRKLVVPRVLAGILMAPMLTVVADFVGILGGWIVARYQLQVSSGLYWSSIFQALYMQDIWMGLIKPFVLGFVIVTIACHVGLRTTGGTQGVGRATTVSVVAGSVGVIAVDFFVTRVLISVMY